MSHAQQALVRQPKPPGGKVYPGIFPDPASSCFINSASNVSAACVDGPPGCTCATVPRALYQIVCAGLSDSHFSRKSSVSNQSIVSRSSGAGGVTSGSGDSAVGSSGGPSGASIGFGRHDR